MAEKALCPWESVSWEESTYFETPEGPPLIRADVHRTFSGGPLEGEGWAVLLCARPQEGSAGFVASEYIRGRIGDRSGTFVIQHMAAMGGPEAQAFGVIVPDTGTGDFKGISGTCGFGYEDGKAVFILNYEIS
jgi:hypothetical protein